ncbi:hypothetical protein [Intrasporangium sp. YIM S08009]|uniref:hypothetical protein n=1 Tax=Intrasporangium zincisolvens TaxID=3080018 RepID=UPI002B056962|nr:hypothetical protein [Intrasporangium sp. YIM S08009]
MRGRRVLGQVLASLAVVLAAATVPGVAAAAPEVQRAAATAAPAAVPAVLAPAPVWGPPVTAVPDRGQPSDVSCPTSTWCMAVDLSGRVMTFNGSAWSAPKLVFPRVDGVNQSVTAVSCPTTAFCLAVSDHGYGVYRSGSWTVTRAWQAPFRAVDCYSPTRCGLVRGNSNEGRGLTTWNGSTLSPTVVAPWASRVDAIACPSTTVCHAIGVEPKGGAIALRTSGSGWVASYLGTAGLSTTFDLSCTSASFCLATSGNAYRAWRWDGRSWSNAARTESAVLLDVESLSCTSPTSCTGVGDGRSGRWNGSSWSVRDLYPIYGASYSMDCATSSTCVVVDNRGRFWRGGGSAWTAPASFDPTSQWVAGLSCPTATFCMATDYLGNALRWNGTAWGSLSRLGTYPSSVSCLSATWCMTVDQQQGTSRLWTGSWQAPVRFDTVNPWSDVVCASSTACFVFQTLDVRRWNGHSWSAPARLFTESVEHAACAGPRFCIAMTWKGQFRTWNGTAWSALRGSGVTNPVRLTCSTGSFCMVESDSNLYSTFDGTSWAARRTVPEYFDTLSCSSRTRCVGTSYDGSVRTWDGSSWTLAPTALPFQAIQLACLPTRCMAMGYEKSSWTS